MRDFVQTKSVADIIAEGVLYNTGFIVPIAETVKRIEDRAVNECRLRDIEEVPTTTADTDLPLSTCRTVGKGHQTCGQILSRKYEPS